MLRPRGGKLEVRQRRSVECRACLANFRADEAGQMLRFNYICGDCHQGGCRLKLVPVEDAVPRRMTVRLFRNGAVVR